jgi:MFS transporter, OPA family, sugar phosphate sensor protein UhpC
VSFVASLKARLGQAPRLEEIQDEGLVRTQYRYWRMRIFYAMYIGYTFYYFTRKSFSYAMPALMQELDYTKAELGILGSILAVSYGISKVVNGVVADKVNPRYFMSFGLILTGFMNIFFGFSSSLVMFAIFWGLNGWFQGWGWPPCARLLTHWYSQSERGTWWSVCSTSHNMGGALIPVLAAFCAASFGWRSALFVPGVLCIAGGLFLLNRLRDIPQSLGLPPVEKYRNDATPAEIRHQEQQLSVKEILGRYVLRNKYIWILCAVAFFVYVVRTAINDWTALYLMEVKGYGLVRASGCVFWFEIGGFIGMLVAGWISDKWFKGRRGPAFPIFGVGLVATILLFAAVPAGGLLFDSVALFGIGFFLFGPQMLIGLAAAELSHKNAAATACSFASGWFAYAGSAAAGFPVGAATQAWGWPAYFLILTLSGAVIVLFSLPLWSARPKALVPTEELV